MREGRGEERQGKEVEETGASWGRRTELGAVSVLVGVHALDVVRAPRAATHGRTPAICACCKLFTFTVPLFNSHRSSAFPSYCLPTQPTRKGGNPRF